MNDYCPVRPWDMGERPEDHRDALLSACRDALALLEDPDADHFQADAVAATLRAVIAKAGGGK